MALSADRTRSLRSFLVWACRQVELRRVRAIDDIDVVIAGDQEHPLGDARELRDRFEELGPFGRKPGIRDIAGHQDGMQRLLGLDFVQPLQDS